MNRVVGWIILSTAMMSAVTLFLLSIVMFESLPTIRSTGRPAQAASMDAAASTPAANPVAECRIQVAGFGRVAGTAHVSVASLVPGGLLRLPASETEMSVTILAGRLSFVLVSSPQGEPLIVADPDGQTHDVAARFGDIVEANTGGAVRLPAGSVVTIAATDEAAQIILATVVEASPLGGPVSLLPSDARGVLFRTAEIDLPPGGRFERSCSDLPI
ncbi:MAG: hypothetical protein KF883_10760 [Thermomicrobiales bacterium]|nr:hypothetical protein [Thermomicrobiales bacterium]